MVLDSCYLQEYLLYSDVRSYTVVAGRMIRVRPNRESLYASAIEVGLSTIFHYGLQTPTHLFVNSSGLPFSPSIVWSEGCCKIHPIVPR